MTSISEINPRLMRIEFNKTRAEDESNSLRLSDQQGARTVLDRRGGWRIFDSNLRDYGRTFEQVSPLGLRRDLKEVIWLGGRKSILDLMATETAVQEAVNLGFGYGLAVSLGFENGSAPPDNGGTVDVLNGDLVSYKTWLNIENRMKKAGFEEGFDVIMARPEGGFSCLSDSDFVHYWLLQHAWKLLSKNNGQMYLQSPSFSWFDNALDYFEQLKNKCGITVRWDWELDGEYGYAFYMKKTPDSPVRLPSPRSLGL